MFVKSANLSPHEMEEEIKAGNNEELFKGVRGFLIFGRFMGIIPYQGVFSSSSSSLNFRWINTPVIYTISVLSVVTLNTFLEFIQTATSSRKNPYEIAQSIRSFLYYIWGTFVFYNFIFRRDQFLNVFKQWRSTILNFSRPDHKLKRDVTLIATVVLVSGTLENAVLYGDIAKQIIEALNGTTKQKVSVILEDYYRQWHKSWSRFFNYHPVLVVLAFVQHKFILFSWNCIDIWITVLARALYFKFKTLCEVSEEKLVRPFKGKPTTASVKSSLAKEWKLLAQDHVTLTDLLQVLENFLSPLIFLSYVVNIYYLAMQLLDGLTLELRKNTVFDSINRPWSFAHLLLRVYFVSICCARINVYAHHISTIINECPAELYSTEISRLDKRVNGGREIGLTGLGCFTVTKPFILTIVGVIFTIEIVLLQVVPDSNSSVGQRQNC